MMRTTRKPTGSAILTTVFLMFGILTISLIGLDIIMGGMAARRAQGASARAYFAAESGMERALRLFKSSIGESIVTSFDSSCQANESIDFSSAEVGWNPTCPVDSGHEHWVNMIDGQSVPVPKYNVRIKNITTRTVELVARGNYLQTNREIYVKFCLPSCQGKVGGESDDCGGTCK